MEYSNYRLDQIQRALRNYQYLCDIFFELAADDKTRKTLEDVLYRGICNDFCFCSGLSNKDNPFYEGERRISMAYLLIRNPDTFNFCIQNKINLFHGTNGSALPMILKYGLNSLDESEQMGIPVTTGEHWSRDFEGRSFVSLSDILEIACGYSTIKPSSDGDLCFELVIAVSFSDIASIRLCHVSSVVPEVGVRDRVPKENISAFCVPSDKIEFVKKVVGPSGIKVFPMDDAETRFYYIDEFNGIFIYPELLEKLKEDLKNRQSKSKFAFGVADFRNLAFNRVLSGIKSKLESIGLVPNEEEGRKL